MVAEMRPVRELFATGPTDRLNHGPQGPRVKAHSCDEIRAPEKRRLRNAWADFLSPIAFQWFATLTFETNVHPEAALKRYRRFTNDLNRALYGRRWMKKPQDGIH